MFKKKHEQNLKRMDVWNEKDSDDRIEYCEKQLGFSDSLKQLDFFFFFGLYLFLFSLILSNLILHYLLLLASILMVAYSVIVKWTLHNYKKEYERVFFNEY